MRYFKDTFSEVILKKSKSAFLFTHMRAFIYNICYVHYRKMRIMRETERRVKYILKVFYDLILDLIFSGTTNQ